MQIESIIKSINIMTIDNEVRGVIRNEVTLDQRMDINSCIVSGVVYVHNLMNKGRYSFFNAKISNIHYYIKGADFRWVRSTSPTTAYFRFETGDINLLNMVQSGVPWESIEKKYLKPNMSVLSSKLNEAMLSTVIDVAIGILLKLIFKI